MELNCDRLPALDHDSVQKNLKRRDELKADIVRYRREEEDFMTKYVAACDSLLIHGKLRRAKAAAAKKKQNTSTKKMDAKIAKKNREKEQSLQRLQELTDKADVIEEMLSRTAAVHVSRTDVPPKGSLKGKGRGKGASNRIATGDGKQQEAEVNQSPLDLKF